VARVVAVFDDLLLGSNVLGMLRAAGHDAVLAGPADAAPEGCDVVVVDLATEGFDGVELVERLRGEGRLGGAKLLGVYSHVHVEQRERGQAAGFDLIVPRSRMAREGAALVDRLVSRG
jgi:CheY-like chemotaxis protein